MSTRPSNHIDRISLSMSVKRATSVFKVLYRGELKGLYGFQAGPRQCQAEQLSKSRKKIQATT